VSNGFNAPKSGSATGNEKANGVHRDDGEHPAERSHTFIGLVAPPEEASHLAVCLHGDVDRNKRAGGVAEHPHIIGAASQGSAAYAARLSTSGHVPARLSTSRQASEWWRTAARC